MKTVCTENHCTGCMACVEKCSKDAITIVDSYDHFNAVINDQKCIDCGLCQKVCQVESPIELKPTQRWLQGWCINEKDRQLASSGGAAYAISKAFIKRGGIVFSCTFTDGSFVFACASNEGELSKFSGSKYVKSNPAGIYKEISRLLATKEVLLIGLPCQTAAIQKFVKKCYLNRLYTVDLICHGSPSQKTLRLFFDDYNLQLHNLSDVKFRVKDNFCLNLCDNKNYRPIITRGVQDLYTWAFLKGVSYTDNCYSCKYACVNRNSDITIGDSWGSELDDDEQKKGISLLMCQTDKGMTLLDNIEMYLVPVDSTKAIASNRQLNTPSEKAVGRDKFFEELKKNQSFTKAIMKTYPGKYLKHTIKKLWIRYGRGQTNLLQYSITYLLKKK